ncbi:MAG: HAD family phosphatase [Chitinophagaceae bacterium]|nr:HAD family phosphatase [Chitinophagaceae bacterium]
MAENIIEILRRNKDEAVIFDLDGTILDNNAFHLKSWKEYLKRIGREMTDEEYNKNINGRTNRDVVKYLYGNDLSEDDIWKYTNEKEALYREMYQPYIKPVEGLIPLLELLNQHNIPMGIATSGIQVNIEFMFEHVPIRQYFKTVVDSSFITHGKPHPEIFLKTAELLGITPEKCLVFEDAVVGIKSAKAAGMKVIAVATTHPREELAIADITVNNYTELL